ncbi:hypothetical protein K1719_033762 [Acacia pycnantha]|nr:hypothetical protein K1719_033762 [Acacia pycnantha]
MFSSTLAIPVFLLLTFIYFLSIFLRSNNHSKYARKRPLALPIIGNIYLLGTLLHRNLQSLANKYWRNMKKLCGNHLISPSKFEFFGPLRKEMVRTMVESLERAATMGEVVNLTEHVNGLMEDMVCKMIFGRTKDDQFDLEGLIAEAFKLGILLILCLAWHLLIFRIGRDNIKAVALETLFSAYHTVSLTIGWTVHYLKESKERFLNSDIDLQGNHFQLIPFGYGRRKCPGQQIGLTTPKLVVAQLIHCFDWNLPNGMAPCDFRLGHD